MMPEIEKYAFGEMVIDGQSYTKDVIITPNGVQPNWWRQEGHRLAFVDLEAVISAQPVEVVVIGTGKFGMMKIPKSVIEKFSQHNIQIVDARTDKAVKLFNELCKTKSLIGAFHLTC
jgi:hypothetical protein